MKPNYTVRRINQTQAKDWIMLKHYAHRVPSISYAFGLYNKDSKMLHGICTYGKPASPNLCEGICGYEYKDDVWELNRLVVDDGLPPNTLSYFVGRTLKNLHGLFILVSYADTGMGHHGYIYQATNWIYTSITKERTDIGTENNSHSRHYDKNLDYATNRKLRTAKHRYVYIIANRKMKKVLLKALNYPILPYPKGDNKRYDASQQIPTQGLLL